MDEDGRTFYILSMRPVFIVFYTQEKPNPHYRDNHVFLLRVPRAYSGMA